MPKLLLVDDHSIVRKGLKLIIEDFLAHAEIMEAHDGDSAFEKIKHNAFDLVVLDVNMPNTDSFGLLQTILSFRASMKIMMFSMNAEEIYAKRYLKMGAMGYLRKDSPEVEIKNAIGTILSGKRYMSPELSEKLLFELQVKGGAENPFDKLSPREFEIVQHLANGDSVAEISQKLKLHTSTVGTHKARIFDKLQCHNIIDLTRMAKVYDVVFA